MNTPSAPQEQYEVFPSAVFDPFPEPQTMPKGWDLSGLFSSSSNFSVSQPAEDDSVISE